MLTAPPTKNGVGASSIILPAGHWPSLLDFLVQHFHQISWQQWRQRLLAGHVLNEQGLPLAFNAAYKSHQKIYYYRHVANEPIIPFLEKILYQDDYLVVADKPHFLPVTPSGRYVQETLLARLKRRLSIDTLSPIHRIDRETAGLVLLSTRPRDRGLYHGLFREHRVHKEYEAIAPWQAHVSMPCVIHNRLVPSAHFMQMHSVPGVPNAHTTIEVLEVTTQWARYGLKPLTGHKHQLRVHMLELGIAILGDRIYPHFQGESCAPNYDNPLRLLAKRLAFICPVSHKKHHFCSEFELNF
jgi:tRNA pseudouridine32 synthase / 23S rRNA pseudouridine746 synthase